VGAELLGGVLFGGQEGLQSLAAVPALSVCSSKVDVHPRLPFGG
jgi:hypothetical protein